MIIIVTTFYTILSSKESLTKPTNAFFEKKTYLAGTEK